MLQNLEGALTSLNQDTQMWNFLEIYLEAALLSVVWIKKIEAQTEKNCITYLWLNRSINLQILGEA